MSFVLISGDILYTTVDNNLHVYELSEINSPPIATYPLGSDYFC